jgi:hypothetical protein
MDPNQLLAQLSQPIKEIARVEADRAGAAAVAQAKKDIWLAFALAVVLSVAIGKIWK